MKTVFRGACWISAILGIAALLGTGFRWAPYWVASHWGGGANLEGANLQGADLQNALLSEAKLRRADLRRANLKGAYLGGGCFPAADLTGADLRGADLRDVILEGPGQLRGSWRVPVTSALYDASTRWPARFDPVKAGAVKVR
jgi:uncharacterized protein YjbI with pentapeptide repeats